MRNCRATAKGFGLVDQKPPREGKLPVKNLQIFFRSLMFFFRFFFVYFRLCLFFRFDEFVFFTSCLGVSERVSFGYQPRLYLLWFNPVTVGTVEYFTRRFGRFGRFGRWVLAANHLTPPSAPSPTKYTRYYTWYLYLEKYIFTRMVRNSKFLAAFQRVKKYRTFLFLNGQSILSKLENWWFGHWNVSSNARFDNSTREPGISLKNTGITLWN